MIINAKEVNYKELNEALKADDSEFEILSCIGQRFIGAGFSDKKITINGIPGNALGAYLNGAVIEVMGNAQDAVGDTMNDGEIIIHGNTGDAVGYAMRGGKIFIKGNAGYRAGIHMKEYCKKKPCLVIGGRAGSFLGEYQAGGIIIVLGLNNDGKPIVSNFPGTGMHGGKMFLRSDCRGIKFPNQVHVEKALGDNLLEITDYIEEFCQHFGYNKDDILKSEFTIITPDSKNPYKQMYVPN